MGRSDDCDIVGMFIRWSHTNFEFLKPIQKTKWLRPQFLTQDPIGK